LVLSVVERVGPLVGEPFAGSLIEYQTQIEEQNVENAKEVVKNAGEKIKKDFNCQILTEVVMGSPKYTIVAKAKENQMNLIILGSHGYGLWERVLLGSVSTFVAHHAECSILISRNNSI
jgi:nucleotide-binding universal stress UspA family protein